MDLEEFTEENFIANQIQKDIFKSIYVFQVEELLMVRMNLFMYYALTIQLNTRDD